MQLFPTGIVIVVWKTCVSKTKFWGWMISTHKWWPSLMNMNVILSALGDILGSKMLIIACKGINFTLRSLSNYPLGVNLDWGSLLTKLTLPYWQHHTFAARFSYHDVNILLHHNPKTQMLFQHSHYWYAELCNNLCVISVITVSK